MSGLYLKGRYLFNPKNTFGFSFSGANTRFEPKPAPESFYQGTRKRWLDKTDAYPLTYVSI